MAQVNSMSRRLRSERGAELIEFALIFPLLLLVLLGMIDFGFLFQRYEVLTNATREGARMAVLPGYDDADVQARVCAYLQTGGIDTIDATTCASWITVDDGTIAVPTGPALTTKIVTVSYPHTFMFIGPIVGLMGGSWTDAKTLTTTAIMRDEVQAAPTPTP